jgi:hypothetical protein
MMAVNIPIMINDAINADRITYEKIPGLVLEFSGNGISAKKHRTEHHDQTGGKAPPATVKCESRRG